MFIEKKTLVIITIVVMLLCGASWNAGRNAGYKSLADEINAEREAMKEAIGEWVEPPKAKNFF